MNSVNKEWKFTMELCGDFGDNRLPTLSFSIWHDNSGLRHSYLEKPTLVVERSAMGRHNIMNITINELVRRLEILHDDLPQSEVDCGIIKYVKQLVNSE